MSILIGIQEVEVVNANPFGLAKQINAPSDAKPPIVSIDSPQNDTNYSDTFNISFSVKAPQYFSRSVIVDVFYTMDNETVTIPHELWTLTQGPGISQYSTSIIAPSLPAGNHSLKIRAQEVHMISITCSLLMATLKSTLSCVELHRLSSDSY